MTHYHIHDIDVDVEDGLDAKQVDDQVTRVVEPLSLAFEETEDLGATFRALIRTCSGNSSAPTRASGC